MKDELFKILFPFILLAMIMIVACNQYPAQKKPYLIGAVVHLNHITLNCVEPLIVDSWAFDSFNEYDGAYHYFYSVHDTNGKVFTHVIDYQLKK